MNDTPAVSESKIELIEGVATLLFPFYADVHMVNTVKKSLTQYSEELLTTLNDFFREDAAHADKIRISITKALPEATIREHLEFFPLMPDYSHRFREHMVNSLRLYPQLPHTQDFTMMPQDVINQCKALITASTLIEEFTVFHGGNTANGIKDDRLVDLIISHANAPQRLFSLIMQRNIADPALLSEILNADAPAISDGTL